MEKNCNLPQVNAYKVKKETERKQKNRSKTDGGVQFKI